MSPDLARSPSRSAPDAHSFTRIICGVDGSRNAVAAAEQAAILAGSAAVELVAVSHASGTGPTAMAGLSASRGLQALDHAATAAKTLGVDATQRLLHGRHAAHVLLDEAAGADLVAVGARPGSRAGGIMLGSTASTVLHEARCSVLVARPMAARRVFPARIVLATDGSIAAGRAAEVAAQIAGRHQAATMVVCAGGPTEIERHGVAEHTALLARATGTDPVDAQPVEDGPAGIVEAARAFDAGLVVMGARGLRGLRALGSVSERLAHLAPCSVLVVRP